MTMMPIWIEQSQKVYLIIEAAEYCNELYCLTTKRRRTRSVVIKLFVSNNKDIWILLYSTDLKLCTVFHIN